MKVHPCHGCIYFTSNSWASGGGKDYYRSCDYIGFHGGSRRPCPPGEKCTVKTLAYPTKKKAGDVLRDKNT